MIDGDDGRHPSSPYYRQDREEQEAERREHEKALEEVFGNAIVYWDEDSSTRCHVEVRGAFDADNLQNMPHHESISIQGIARDKVRYTIQF